MRFLNNYLGTNLMSLKIKTRSFPTDAMLKFEQKNKFLTILFKLDFSMKEELARQV
jgi:hypothetical protein